MRLVVDANILIGELLRKRGRILFNHPRLNLYISERVVNETGYELNKRINLMIQKEKIESYLGEETLSFWKSTINDTIKIVHLSEFSHLEEEAKNRIPRDPHDWEIVAISILLNADIWTQDSDFIGCGRATWTTETLIYFLNKNT
ncbi:putative toxin-antitoxin system toxin component, PIN family [Geminocystis sp. CENA526]|uniref:putative toxin-antitoxin system toxin component, PIN family n=1 Tax=Geminocystis sp. CENA526 TaxID=1355871 RepID=UPI003D6F22B7